METDELDMEKYWEVYDENVKKNPTCPPIKIVFYKKKESVGLKKKESVGIGLGTSLSNFRKDYKKLISHFYEEIH